MSIRIFLDIETIPPDEKEKSILSSNVLRYVSNCNNSYRQSPDFNQKKTSEVCSEELFRKLSLHAELGRILCIGVLLEKNGKEWRKGVFGYDTDSQTFHLNEEKTLRGFWRLMEEEFNPYRDLIVGHNVMDFDLPFIYKRSRILKLKPTVQLSFIRYRSRPIYDTMREWALWNMRERFISLSVLAELLGIELEKLDGIDGSRVYDEFMKGNHALIADYCLRDVELSREIYHRMNVSDGMV
ncbi:MAG: ribonuclease H-like domain-containing protein [Aridibacter sp.]